MSDGRSQAPPSPFARNPHLGDVISERPDEEAADGWLLRHRVTHQGRAESLRRVFLNAQPRWASAFAVPLLLAAGIAALGLRRTPRRP